MNIKKIIIAITGLLFLSSCGHHMDVRPGPDGIHNVKVQTGDKKFASRYAFKQANNFCKKRDQYAAVINEKVKYVGSMDEAKYNALRKASSAATTAGVGTGIYALAKKKSSDSKTAKVAAAATLGGMAGKAMVKDGYVAEISFKCQ